MYAQGDFQRFPIMSPMGFTIMEWVTELVVGIFNVALAIGNPSGLRIYENMQITLRISFHVYFFDDGMDIAVIRDTVNDLYNTKHCPMVLILMNDTTDDFSFYARIPHQAGTYRHNQVFEWVFKKIIKYTHST